MNGEAVVVLLNAGDAAVGQADHEPGDRRFGEDGLRHLLGGSHDVQGIEVRDRDLGVKTVDRVGTAVDVLRDPGLDHITHVPIRVA
ncbi:hypothetical protein GCM10025876_34260 [Demequina litorisediminis]|uniref:Uncharacterized protein n=1 Tax=Demequina litorisediminis TaxID=1849022 RepID=A0ABQ6IKI4_9MICO|nr:hypothetical protein GCM10025876_34260 [Demequina litorisediminis]